MKIEQIFFEHDKWNEIASSNKPNKEKVQFVLSFGDRNLISESSAHAHLKSLYPNACIIMGSTSGEIYNNMVNNHTIITTAVEFEKTTIKTAAINISAVEDSFELGKKLYENLDKENLQYIFVLSDGGLVNGSELVKGMNAHPHPIPISGGLAGDDTRFEKTVVGLNAIPQQGEVIAVGFYGNNLHVGHGSMGGWDMFGPERTITKSDKNVLYEIDGRNALDLYKEYLNNYASELPGAALLFPLSIKLEKDSEPLVRTILSIDDAKKTMTFAGDLPEGCSVRLMKSNFDRIIDASSVAAGKSFESIKEFATDHSSLSILISCVGRKLVLNERIDEEVESASELFNNKTVITGFYSYGEISPLKANSNCELHNQTMTITTLCEI
jgi:hypothetical protein